MMTKNHAKVLFNDFLLEIKKEDRSAIAVLAARFAEGTDDIMSLADMIEADIMWKMAEIAKRKEKQPCGNAGSTKES